MDTIRAIFLMILAMSLLALSDMFIKLATGHLPIGQVMVLLSVGGTLFFILIARLQRVALLTRDALHPFVMLRNGLEIVGAIGLVISLATVPLPIFAAIMQVAPLVVTLGAALILKEPVGWRRWMAVFVGMAGMLMILRPGADGFAPDALWAVLGVTALGLRDLITRLAPSHIRSIALSTWGFAATIPAGFVVLLIFGDAPGLSPFGLVHAAGAVLVTSIGYYATTTAMRMAPAAIVSPFRYTRLVFTMGIGMVVFGQYPDGLTLAGSAIIIASGLYTFLRERRLALAAQQMPAAAR